MYPRGFVRSVAALGGIGSLAGCTGGDEATPTPSPEPTPTPTPEGVARAEAESHYDDAIGYLLENAEPIDEWASGEGDRSDSAIADARDNVERAREALDEAEAVAPDDLVAQIDNTRAIASFQAEVFGFYDIVNEFEAQLADAGAYGDAEEHERAAETYGSALDTLDEAEEQLAAVEAAHAEIDPSLVDEDDLEYRGEYIRYVEGEDPGAIDTQAHLVEGNVAFHEMFIEFEAATTHWENEAFVEARERFEAGQAARGRAEEAYTAAADHEFAWPDLRQEAITLGNIAADLKAAFDLWIEATHEAEAGNIGEANDLLLAGFGILEEAFQQG
jgi:hypothetical protein